MSLGNGRMIIGLGTSGPQVIEHFHGIKFNPPLTRMKEYVDIINMMMARTPLNYNGKLFKLQRGFTMRFEPPRKHIPICIASLNQKSVEFTAQKADGWLPVMIPLNSLKKAIADFRAIANARRPQPARCRGQGARSRDVTDERRSRTGRTGRQRRVLRRAHGHLLFRATHAFRFRRRRAQGQAGVGCGRLEGGHRGACRLRCWRSWAISAASKARSNGSWRRRSGRRSASGRNRREHAGRVRKDRGAPALVDGICRFAREGAIPKLIPHNEET